ncbi:MAG: GTP 3',8-cyclase MoaA [Ignavibacteria bacterium]|nr:GTP 3',8-cyclase MoaA [Ignavibacteria bacterium]
MLTDSFGRVHNYLRISVTDRCNLKCVYCMPDEILSGSSENKNMSVSEIYEIAKVFSDLGINKIRITGGEPFVRKEIAAIFTNLSDLPVTLAVSTNALLIDRHIDLLKNCGVKNINVSLDTLNPEEFLSITKSNSLEKIFSNIVLLIENEFRVKINFVVMKGVNENAVTEAAGLTKNFGVEVRFIEYMPFKGNKWSAGKVYSHDEILDNIRSKYNIFKLHDEQNDTSKKYGITGHAGSIGIISTITKPFCSGCNRLRLTSDGKLKNCLFSKGETDLLTAFRKGEDIKHLIISGLTEKEFERGGQFESENIENRSMVNIGG